MRPIFVDIQQAILTNKRSFFAVSVFLAGLVCLDLIGGETVAEWFQFDRQRIAAGEIWRIYTCNWVHFGWNHTLMNVAGLGAIVFSLFWRLHDVAWWLSLVLIPLCVGFALYFVDSNTDVYRGFSAAAYGILLLGLCLEWRHNRWIMSAAIAILLGKIVMEQLPGYDVDYLKDEIGVAVAIEAHLWGVVAGAVLAAMVLIVEWRCKEWRCKK